MAEETKKPADVVAVVPDVPEAEKASPTTEKEVAVPEAVEEGEKPSAEEEKITKLTSFKEETNVAGELPDPEKVALDELKQLVQQALNNHEFTAPPPPPPVETAVAAEEPAKKVEEAVVEEDGAKTVEAIKETVVATPPEEVSIWGIPLLADERSDVVLLKFLRARDFKVKEAFAMLKSVVAWRKEFKIEQLLEEDWGNDQQNKVVYIHGTDKEGHPVCYNAFDDDEKRTKFLRWRIQFLEKSIRKLDFNPHGINTFVQVHDLKNSPGFLQRELRIATNQALQLFQDNYPEFVSKQVFINVPWWYLALYRMISPFLTQRTKSKFVFAGPSKSAETLFKYISPEQVPVQYGGLSVEGEFTTAEPVTEEIIKPATKHTIEFPVSKTSVLVWEARVVGWEVAYGAEFVPRAEDGYTVIVQKSKKIGAADETVISGSFKVGEPGKIVLSFDNQSSKKKKLLLFRSKTKISE